MQDARLSTALPNHPKTKKLIRRLGDGGAWKFVCLILWAAANRSDGDLSGLTDEDLELAVDWTGEDGALVAALVEVGFVDGEQGSRHIHDWEDWNPWAAGAEARSEKSRWAALCKQHGRREAAKMMPEYAKRLLDACQNVPDAVPDSASGTPLADSGSAPSPSPSPLPKSIPTTSGPQPVSELPIEPDPIFGTGLDFLKRKGVPEKQARSFLGLLRKELADDLTVSALLAEADRIDASQPVEWLRAAAKARKNQRGPPNQQRPLSKSAEAFLRLENRKNGNGSGVVRQPDNGGRPALAGPESGPDAGDGTDRRHGGRVV